MRLGISWGYSRRQACYSGASPARPALTFMLAAFSRTMPDHDFTFTGTQHNKGCHAAVHVDSDSFGMPWLIGLGDCVGGNTHLARETKLA